MFREDDILIIDMYAGVEHLGRATVDFVDAMIVVVEPTKRSLGTAAQIKGLASDIGLNRLWLVGNKVRTDEEREFLEKNSPGIPLLGTLPMDLGVLDADRLGEPVYDHVPALFKAAEEIANTLLEPYPEQYLEE
jgi:CO dehydrogenase maturation factor